MPEATLTAWICSSTEDARSHSGGVNHHPLSTHQLAQRGHSMFQVGLNPYGLAYYFGRQGRGTPRVNPNPHDLGDFVKLGQELGAKVLEISEDWVAPLSNA